MSRKVILSGAEALSYAQHRLSLYADLQAMAVDADHPMMASFLKQIMETILQQCCTGAADVAVSTILRPLNLPQQVVDDIENSIRNDLLQLIMRGFGCIYPSRIYRYQCMDGGDFIIDEEIPLLSPSLEVEDEADAEIQPQYYPPARSTISHDRPPAGTFAPRDPAVLHDLRQRRAQKRD